MRISRVRGTPVLVSLTNASNVSAQLALGRYRVTASDNCFIQQGASTVTATTSEYPLWEATYIEIDVMDTGEDDYVAGICAGAGTSTLYICPVE